MNTVDSPSVKFTVQGSKSILGFEGGGSRESWFRYITIEGRRAYEIGNICQTCEFYFQRLEGANKSAEIEDTVTDLNNGLRTLSPDFVAKFQKILPDGEYAAVLWRIRPTLIQPNDPLDYFCREQIDLWGLDGFWGLPHNPRTEYYRLSDQPISAHEKLFQFLIPMFPKNWLNEARVAEYQQTLSENEPTAVSLSVLDIKAPSDSSDECNDAFNCHWCFAHYLIDGHHKALAAALMKQPITLLSFVALDQGISSKEDAEAAMQRLPRL